MKVLADTFYIENGNIGIGTTEPRQLLDINNGHIILNNGNLGIGTDYAQQSLHVVGPSLLNGPIATNDNNIHVGIGSVYANGFYGSNAIINTIFAANVGIGTTFAKEALHIYGNIFTHGIITTCNLTVLGDTIIFDTITSNTDQMVITNVGSGPALIVRQEGDEPVAEFYDNETGIALYIGNNGNIGVGTSIPLHKLSVYGDTFLNGPITTNNNSINAGAGTITASQFIGTASKVAYDLVPGDYILGSNYNGLTADTWRINASSNNIPSTLVSRDSKGDIYTANVGINTSLATNALTVYGSSLLYGSINTSNNNINAGTGYVTAANFYGIATQVSQSLTPGDYILGNSYNGSIAETWIINASSNNIPSTLVSRDANNRIFISNVGIGTTDIIGSLNVLGKSILNGFVSTCNNDLDIGSGTLFVNTIQNNQLYTANIGIGTSVNRDVLDIEGYARTTLGYKVGNREIINPNGNIAWSNLIFYPFVDAGTGISGGGNLTSNITISVDSTVVRTVGPYTLTGAITMSGGLNMNNTNITNVNNIAISDPGPNEGISWTGGNLWKIYESPDSGANTAGDLQFVTGTHQRKFTIYTTGDAQLQKTLFTSNVITTYLTVEQNAIFQGPIFTPCNVTLTGSTLYASAIGIGTTFTNVPLRVDGNTILNGFVTTCNNDLNIGTGTLTGATFTGTAYRVSQLLTAGSYIFGNSYDGSSPVTWNIIAASNNQPSTLVARDAFGHTYLGNVGIGTSSATHALTVQGMTLLNGPIDTLNNSINAGTGTITASTFAGTATNVSQLLTPGDYIVGSSYDGGVARTWSLYAYSNSIPTSLVTRDAFGSIYACNVGIGTNIATHPLTVKGNTILDGLVSTCNQDIIVGSGSVTAANFYGVATQVSQLLSPGDYIVGNPYNGSNAETWNLYISSNIVPSTIVARDIDANLYAANIGIGTTSVQVAFEVHSTNSMLLPKGTSIQRPAGVTGYVRYNTELDQFEGYGAGNAWGSLGGVKSTDQQTYISATNDSNLLFYTAGQLRAVVNSNGNLGIGTDNPIVSLHINRTDSILLPKGTSVERPEGVAGLIRYNTELDQFEGYGSGNAWGSLGGVKSTDQQTYITATNDSNLLFYTAGQLRAVINSNGNLGLGSDNPIYPFYIQTTNTSKLAYADVSIPNQFLEYPPAALTSNYTTLTNQAYGNGLYIVTASSTNSNISESYQAFDETALSWFTLNTATSYYDGTNTYVGSNNIVPDYYGEWIKLQLSSSIILGAYTVYCTSIAGVRHPQDYKLYGSTDDINWNVLDTQTNITTDVGTYQVSLPGNTTPYTYYALVIHKNNGPYANTIITEWKLYGTATALGSGFLFTNSNMIYSSILSERQNTLFSYSVNSPYRTSRDSTRPGVTVAMNTETDGLFGDYESYSIKTYPKNTSNEQTAFTIDLNTLRTYLAGNVGIGSTQPNQKLDVAGNITAYNITAQNFYGTVTQVSQPLNPGNYILGASYNGSSNITWNINASTSATPSTLVARDASADLYSQKVGINTTITSHYLTVFGDTLLNGQVSTNSNSIDVGTGSVTASNFYGTVTRVQSSLTANTNAFLYGSNFDGSTTVQWGVYGSVSNISNYLVSRDTTGRIYISNVGIGTTIITDPLTVSGSSFLDGPINTNSNNINAGTGSITAANFYGTATQVSQSLTPGNYILGSSYTGSIADTWNINAQSSNVPNTVVARDGSGKVYLGYVGIGTDYSTERLYIEGNVLATGTLTASNLVVLGDSVILNTITSNTEQLLIINDGTGPALIVKQSGAQPIAEFYDNESGTALHIGNDGTVGIGTDMSPYRLTVQGDTLILGTLITSNNNIHVGTGSVTAQNFYGTATQVSQSLDPGSYILGASYTGSSNITWNINASTNSIANTLVARDGNADLYTQKVGINTTVTSHFLTVFGDTLLNGQVSTNSNNLDVGTGSVTAQNFYGTATRVQSSLTADTNAYLYGSNYDGSTMVQWGVYGSVSNISNYLVSRDITGRIYISNVGIGTTIITDPLTVSGSSFLDGPINTNSNSIDAGTGSVTAQNFYGTATQVSQSLDPGSYILGASYTGSSNITWNINASTNSIANTLVARDANADLFSQKVGINTTVTSHFLTVFGDTLLNGQVSTNSNNLDVGTGSVTAQNFYGTATRVQASLSAGNYLLGASFNGSSNITWNINASASSTASTLVARDATSTIYAANVGIGTTVARTPLDVVGTIQTSNLTATSSIYSATQFLGNTGTAALPSYSWLNDRDTGVFNPIANSIALTVGGSEKIRLISSGNLGIGTTNPLYSVHIESKDALLIPKGSNIDRPTGTSGLIRYNTELDRFEGYGTSWALLGGGGGTGTNITSDDGFTIVQVADDGNTTFINDTIQNAILTGSGNLGIGVTSPTQKLHVGGNAIVSDTLYTSNLVLYNSIQYDSLNPALMFEFEIKPTRYTEQISTVMGKSNFTVPVMGLFDILPEHVHIYHNGFKLGYLNSNLSDYTIAYSYSNSIPVYTVVDVTLKQLVYNNSVVDIQVYPKTLTPGQIGMVVQDISYNYWKLSLTGGNSNIYWNSGNVGIGIATPSVSLHVNKTDAIIVPTGTTAERPGNAQGSIRYNTELNTFEGYSTSWGPIGGGGGTAIETIGFTSVTTSNDNYLRFTTSNTLQAVIDPYGNVGIGTDAPQEKLHVQGNALVTDTLYSSNIVFYNNIIFSQNNSGLNYNFAMQPTYYTEIISNSVGKSNFIVEVPGVFYVEPKNTQVFLNGHKLGYISSTSNDYFINNIQYSSNTSVNIQLRTAVFNTDVVDIVIHPESFTSNQVGYFIQNLNSYWEKQTSPDRIYYTSGNVGIGTNSPSEKLDVFGNMKIAGHILPSACNVYNIGSSNLRFKDLYLSGTTIDLGGTLISADPSTGQLVVATPSGAPVDISTNTVSASNINIVNNTLITYNGNVGIGTSTPRFKLEVNGSITPSFCNVYDIGSTNLRFKELYLSSNGIDVESVKIRSDTSNTIIVPNIRVNNTDISEWIRVNKPIKKFIENPNGGRYPYDSIVVVNYDDNIIAVGNNVATRFGVQTPEAPGFILSLPNKERADKVYCNTRNLFAISMTSNLYGSGENSRGQVGLAAGSGVANVANLTLTAISNCKKVGQSADINGYSSMFLTYDGKVYSAGENQYGQLGDGTQTDSGNNGPRLTLGPGNTYGNPTSNVLDVIGVGGYDGTNFPESYCALLSDRSVWCVGYGGYGQMGNNTTTAVNTTWKQVQINTGSLAYLSNVAQISGCGNYSPSSFYAIDLSGFLWSWGYNSQGQLGTGNTTNQSRAFKVTTFGSNNVVDIYAANSDNAYCIVKLSNNTFWGCGYNGYGQLGLGNTTNQTTFQQITSLDNKNIDKIYISRYHCFAINFNTNRIYGAGINQNGLLGLGNATSPVTTFTEVMFNIRSPIVDILPNWSLSIGGFTLILTEDGHIYFTGQTRYGYANTPNRDISFFTKNTFCITGG